MEYYSELKKNKPTAYAMKWINIKDMILSERSQTEKEYILYDSILMKLEERQI